MGKNYRCHQIGIRGIVQLNSDKHGFKRSRSLFFQKEVFLKFCRIHMKTPESCTSSKMKLHCRCFPMNFAKFLRIHFCRTPPDDCYWIFFIHQAIFFATRLTNRNQVFSIFEYVYTAFERDEYHELCIHFTLRNRRPSCCSRETVVAAGICLRHQKLTYTEFLCSTIL